MKRDVAPNLIQRHGCFGRQVQCRLKTCAPRSLRGTSVPSSCRPAPVMRQEFDPMESALEPHLPPSAWAEGTMETVKASQTLKGHLRRQLL